MVFTQAISSCFSNYVRFSGRSGRSEYWYWILFYVLVAIVGGIIGAIGGDTVANIISIGVALVFFLPSLAVGVRRFHDIDKSGWWILIALIPIIGGLIILYFFVQPSDEEENRFGPVPEPGVAS